jgi:NAD(P)-dependent dehydrogenase (short-subunit alcohol dehydrogenase family)
MADVTLGGKVALVVGAANGIGRAIAIELARAGACVVCTDVNDAGIKDTVAFMTGSDLLVDGGYTAI